MNTNNVPLGGKGRWIKSGEYRWQGNQNPDTKAIFNGFLYAAGHGVNSN